MTHYELPIFAFLAALLVLIPLPCQWRIGNIAACAIIAWAFAVDIAYGVNAIIWASNTSNAFPIWCDIVTKLVIGASYALPISFMCICKHLAEVSSSSSDIAFNYKDRRRRTVVFETVMCFGLPFVFMGLYCIVQDHRFDIIEDIGCQSALYASIPAIFILWFPQLLFSVITMIYAAIAFHHFIRRRLIFVSHINSSRSGLTTNHYFWLISMAIMNTTWNTILTILNLYNGVSGGLRPWTSWDDVHSNWSHVDIRSQKTMPSESYRIIMLLWWGMPVSSIIFFIFQYGLRQEIKEGYTRVWTWVKATIFNGRHLERGETIFRVDPHLKPLKLDHPRSKGFSAAFHSVLLPRTSSPLSSPTRARHHFIHNSEDRGSMPSTINLSTDDLRLYRLHSSIDRSTAEESSTLGHVQAGERPPRLPEIPLVSPFSSYLPPSPPFTDLVGCQRDPGYRRPLYGDRDSVNRPSKFEGIVITVHRHASVDITV